MCDETFFYISPRKSQENSFSFPSSLAKTERKSEVRKAADIGGQQKIWITWNPQSY